MNPGKIYRFIRLFSLDIVAGAVAGVFLSSNVMGVELQGDYFYVLAITVWLIYIVDHLFDAVRAGEKSASATHSFFYEYKIPIIVVFFLIAIIDFRLVVSGLEPKFIEFGIALGGATAFYLLLNRYYGTGPKIFFIKEVWIALIYSIAIWGGPIIAAGDKINIPQGLLMLAFSLFIFSNVLICSFFEKELDNKEGLRSFVLDFGEGLTMKLSVLSAGMAILIALVTYFIFGGFEIPILVTILISSGYLIIMANRDFFAERERYEILANLLLLLSFLTIIG